MPSTTRFFVNRCLLQYHRGKCAIYISSSWRVQADELNSSSFSWMFFHTVWLELSPLFLSPRSSLHLSTWTSKPNTKYKSSMCNTLWRFPLYVNEGKISRGQDVGRLPSIDQHLLHLICFKPSTSRACVDVLDHAVLRKWGYSFEVLHSKDGVATNTKHSLKIIDSSFNLTRILQIYQPCIVYHGRWNQIRHQS